MTNFSVAWSFKPNSQIKCQKSHKFNPSLKLISLQFSSYFLLISSIVGFLKIIQEFFFSPKWFFEYKLPFKYNHTLKNLALSQLQKSQNLGFDCIRHRLITLLVAKVKDRINLSQYLFARFTNIFNSISSVNILSSMIYFTLCYSWKKLKCTSAGSISLVHKRCNRIPKVFNPFHS